MELRTDDKLMGIYLSPEQMAAAARTVLRHAKDDSETLLEMLGLGRES